MFETMKLVSVNRRGNWTVRKCLNVGRRKKSIGDGNIRGLYLSFEGSRGRYEIVSRRRVVFGKWVNDAPSRRRLLMQQKLMENAYRDDKRTMGRRSICVYRVLPLEIGRRSQ